MKNQYVQIQNWSNVKNLKYALWRDFFMNKNFRNLVAYAFIVMMPIFLVATIFSWQVNVAQAVKCSDSNNAPYDMSGYRSNVGSTYQFKIQAASGGSTGWGTDVYTQDSRLDFMVIHAGALTVGQTGIVRVTVLGPQSSYTGSARNYIRTSDYGYINGISYSVVLQQACTSPDYFAYCNVTTDTNYGGYSCHGTCYNGNGNYPTCTLPAATYSCSGTQPSNSSMWDATSGLTSPASYVYSGSNTSAQCEYACASGYTLSGGSCVPISATVTNFKICNNSCTTGSPYSVPPTGGITNFTFGLGDTRTLCACSGASDCTTGTNTQVMSSWSASTPTDPQDAVNLSTNAGYCTTVTPRSTGVGKSDIITATPTP